MTNNNNKDYEKGYDDGYNDSGINEKDYDFGYDCGYECGYEEGVNDTQAEIEDAVDKKEKDIIKKIENIILIMKIDNDGRKRIKVDKFILDIYEKQINILEDLIR